MRGTRDLYWENSRSSAQGGSTVFSALPGFSSAYTAVNRLPLVQVYGGNVRLPKGCSDTAGGGCDLAWFQANHPDWIIYTDDQKTPAYMFNDRSWVPLDISNPTVQEFIKTNLYAHVLNVQFRSSSRPISTPMSSMRDTPRSASTISAFKIRGTKSAPARAHQ
jgi:hypothetical protein